MGALKKYFIIFLFLIFITSYSQESIERFEVPANNDVDKSEENNYDNEFTYGIQFATNGGILAGLALKYAWLLKDSKTRYHLLGLDIVHVEHPKELTLQNPRGITGYTFGKSADIICFRLHYGQEFILFHKAAEEGIQVSFIGAAGPTLAYRKPYIVYYNTSPDDIPENATVEEIQFNTRMNDSKILGHAGMFTGFNDMTAHLGVHAKTSLNFEYGKFEKSVVGIEIGMMTELFAEKIIVMPYIPEQNKQLFFSLFATLYYGFR